MGDRRTPLWTLDLPCWHCLGCGVVTVPMPRQGSGVLVHAGRYPGPDGGEKPDLGWAPGRPRPSPSLRPGQRLRVCGVAARQPAPGERHAEPWHPHGRRNRSRAALPLPAAPPTACTSMFRSPRGAGRLPLPPGVPLPAPSPRRPAPQGAAPPGAVPASALFPLLPAPRAPPLLLQALLNFQSLATSSTQSPGPARVTISCRLLGPVFLFCAGQAFFQDLAQGPLKAPDLLSQCSMEC